MTKFIIIDAWKKCNWICRKLLFVCDIVIL